MKLLSWNICHGGGNRRDAICHALAVHDPDVIVLSEVHCDSVRDISSSLSMEPWKFYASTAREQNVNSLCVLSRTPIEVRDCCPVPGESSTRWLDVDLPAYGFGVGALHIPLDAGSKQRFWTEVVKAATLRIGDPFLFIGDLNTGLRGIDETGRTFVCAPQFKQMTEIGWADTWRHFHGMAFEPTWISSRNNPFRLDHGFASPALMERLSACDYSHCERESKISDHSMLVLEIAEP